MKNVRDIEPKGFWSIFFRTRSFAMGGQVLQEPIRKGTGKKPEFDRGKKRGSRGQCGRSKGNSGSSGSSAKQRAETKHREVRSLCKKVCDTSAKLIKAINK